MNTSFVECNICFELKAKDMIFPLKCCHSNNICKNCCSQLQKNECPFCRIPNGNISGRTRSVSNSFPSSGTPVSFMDIHVTSFDDMTYYSKIYRRKRKQLMKLQQREENYFNNYVKNILKNQNKKKNKSMNEIKKNIRYDIKNYKFG